MGSHRDLDLEATREILEKEREDLKRMSAAGSDERQPVELDQQSVGRLSRMDALQMQAMANALESRRQGRLQRIDKALQLIEQGDYGYCTECGEAIPAKRIAIDPAVIRCVGCAA